MKKALFFFLFAFIFNTAYSQAAGIKLADSLVQWKFTSRPYFKPNKNLNLSQSSGMRSLAFVSPFKYADQLGFVCKWELRMDAKTKNPVRLRLGSYEYVNRLEGK